MKSQVKKTAIRVFVSITLLIPSFAFSQVPDLFENIDFSNLGTTTEEIEGNIRSISENLNKEILKMSTEKSITLNLLPRYPKPNENVSVRVSSTLVDMKRAEVSWYIDRELITKRIGAERFNFTTKDTGESTRIGVVITSVDGLVVEKIINVTPIEIELLWEADTYTPPFYKGKALLSPNSPVKIVAIPKIKSKNGKSIDPKTFVYLWESKIDTLQNSSGYGQNVLYTEAPRPFRENSMSVRVSTRDGSLESKATFDMQIDDPVILFYEDHPTEGVRYEQILNNGFNLKEKELSIRAVPYFFAKNDKIAGNLTYSWLLNGKDTVGDKESLTLRQEGEGGVARINIRIKNIARRFQSARSSFELNFGRTDSFRF